MGHRCTGCVVPPTVQEKRSQRGLALFGQQEAERGQCFSLMIPLSSQCLEDNIYRIKGKNRSNWFRNMSLMPVNFEMLVCWED